MGNSSACTDECIIARIAEIFQHNSFIRDLRATDILRPLSSCLSLCLRRSVFFPLILPLPSVHSKFLYVAVKGDWMNETIAQRRPLGFRFPRRSWRWRRRPTLRCAPRVQTVFEYRDIWTVRAGVEGRRRDKDDKRMPKIEWEGGKMGRITESEKETE